MRSQQQVMITSGSGSELDRVVIVDGYVDEPTNLGVPPYISPYPRYIAGAIWTKSSRTEVIYQTIDDVRRQADPQDMWSTADLILLIAGMIVPGKYLGGTPISVKEAKRFFSDVRLEDVPKILVGPWGRFGCGLEGGRLALSSDVLTPPFEYIATGDPEIVLAGVMDERGDLSLVNFSSTRESLQEVEEFSKRGARVLSQHPGYSSGHMICEIETYQGCPRYITGGCSFCTEPLYGEPKQRTASDVAQEIGALYEQGARAFRIGNQADLFTFGSKEIGEEEFPKPDPNVIEELFSKVRRAAPELQVLHIDNVNPGTIARHPRESREVSKSIIKHHTSGDVAAFGVESVDPEVIRRNNLKADEEEVIEAIRLLNEVGGHRPEWGLPHLLPGINLLYGLPGESKKTLEYNYAFLKRLVEENLIVRRINIRQVIGFSGTRMIGEKPSRVKRHNFFRHKKQVREAIDLAMIKKVAPSGTVIRSVFMEQKEGNNYLLRPLGTYPLLCFLPSGPDPGTFLDVFVVDHGPRSLTVLPFPLKVNNVSLAQWKSLPGIGSKRAARIRTAESMTGSSHLESIIETEIPPWLTRALQFE
ncbi:MAG: radical SAM protein [Candidatus Thorarchaeota archaeon]|jgi:radical SAM superfamily enzyme with C-terminal helix-hairpin-helix motif